MRERARAWLPFVLTVLLTAGAVIGVDRVLSIARESQVDVASRRAIEQARAVFLDAQGADTLKLEAALGALLGRADLREAFAARDRARLMRLSATEFEDMRERLHISHWYFEEPESVGTVFLRVHSPGLSGDRVGRLTYEGAVRTQTYSAGLELGRTAVALRAVHPYYAADGRTVLGYMELGQEVDTFLEGVARRRGDAVGLLLLKDRLDRAQWSAMCEESGSEDTWDAQSNWVLAAVTDAHITREFGYNGSPSGLPNSGLVLGVTPHEDRTVAQGVFPIRDVAGAVIGAVLLESDITHSVAAIDAARFRTRAITVTFALLMTVNAAVHGWRRSKRVRSEAL